MSLWPVISSWTHQWTGQWWWTVHGLHQGELPSVVVILHGLDHTTRAHWYWLSWGLEMLGTISVGHQSLPVTHSTSLDQWEGTPPFWVDKEHCLQLFSSYRFFTSVSVHTVNITTSGSPVAGQMYTLLCTGTLVGNSSLIPMVTLRNSTRVVTSGNGITVSNGNLTFNPLHTSHGGQYNCQSVVTSVNASTIMATTNVIVQSKSPYCGHMSAIITLLLSPYTYHIHPPKSSSSNWKQCHPNL